MGRLISRVRRLVWASAARELSQRGDSMLMWQVVNELNRSGPRAQKALAEAIAQHPAGVCRVVEELEHKGMARQERDPEDRRRSVVSLTAKGKKWLEEVQPSVREGILEILSVLTPAEAEVLRELLLKVVQAADAAPPAKARGAR